MQAPKLGCTLMRERSHLEICLWVRSSCKPIHAVKTQGMQRADACTQAVLHLSQGVQPPIDLPLCVLMLCTASDVDSWGLCQQKGGYADIGLHLDLKCCFQACGCVYFLSVMKAAIWTY